VGLFDEALLDIKQNALELWDYSSVFPPAYTGTKGCLVMDGWPYQLIEQMEATSNQGQLTIPIISISSLNSSEEPRTLGEVYAMGGSGPLGRKIGRRQRTSFLISAWADQQLGGMDMVRKLAAQVHGCIMYYSQRLTKVRHLVMFHSREHFDDNAQLYRFDVSVEGEALVTIDV
jgi:hypothetical protein